MAAPGDVASQMGWRYMRAKVLARRGRFDEAESLAKEAARMAKETDHLYLIGETLMALTEVLRLAGKREEAVSVLREALEVHEKKGNLVGAGWARRVLEELAAGH
jgi:tetratricopeptide (TPR) repeat protein